MDTLLEIIKKFHLLSDKPHAKKLGQNFLLDMGITRKIASCVPLDVVIEIGPGPGGLTRALLEKASCVYAIEKDSQCLLALQSLKSHYQDKLILIEGDALKVNIFDIQKHPFRIVANLPYNIGTELLIRWIHEQHNLLLSMTIMLQKEVVERIIAKPNTSAYGRLSIIAQYACVVRKEFDVSAQSFMPSPKVTSSVVTLVPKANIEKLGLLETLTRIAFGNRRKMLRNTLGRHYPHIKEFQKEIRPETIPVSGWEEMLSNVF